MSKHSITLAEIWAEETDFLNSANYSLREMLSMYCVEIRKKEATWKT